MPVASTNLECHPRKASEAKGYPAISCGFMWKLAELFFSVFVSLVVFVGVFVFNCGFGSHLCSDSQSSGSMLAVL